MTTSALGDVAKLVRGITFKPSERVPVGSPGSVACLRTANIQEVLDLSDLIAVPASKVLRQEQRVRAGDILVASANSWDLVGRCVAVGELDHEATAGGFISILRADHSVVDARYLYRWLSSGAVQHRVRQCARQTTNIANLSAERFLSLRVPLPSLREQQRIAAILAKADGIRRKRQESLRLLEEFLRSAFLEMFGEPVVHPSVRSLPPGWQLTSVDGIKVKARYACAGGPFGSSLTRSDYVPEPGVPVLRGNNLVAETGVFRDGGFVFVSEEKARALSRNLAAPGDIVFTQRGTLGQVAMIPLSARHPRYLVSQSQMKLTVNPYVSDPTYVVHYFLSPRAVLDMQARTLATGVPHINLSILRAFPIVLPPLSLQRQFADLAARHGETALRYATASRESEALFDSLAQQAFWGEL